MTQPRRFQLLCCLIAPHRSPRSGVSLPCHGSARRYFASPNGESPACQPAIPWDLRRLARVMTRVAPGTRTNSTRLPRRPPNPGAGRPHGVVATGTALLRIRAHQGILSGPSPVGDAVHAPAGPCARLCGLADPRRDFVHAARARRPLQPRQHAQSQAARPGSAHKVRPPAPAARTKAGRRPRPPAPSPAAPASRDPRRLLRQRWR
ncbi:MAG: hypothetical protein JWQ74_1895 [Marmoricola sp.]|nr:hypothetical protein [Marmoricola sp.]